MRLATLERANEEMVVMMTTLEKLLCESSWVSAEDQFTTLRHGQGFVLYRQGGKMWLGGLSPEATTRQAKTHNRPDPRTITAYWSDRWHYGPLFVCPASPEFVAQVVLNVYPNLK